MALTLPPGPPARRPVPLSLVGLLVPLGMAAALWLATRSPYALLFAGIGPLLAVGGWWERRRQAAKELVAATAEHRATLAELREELEAAHDAERARLRAEAGDADAALAESSAAALWSRPQQPTVVLGRGVVASATALTGRARGEEERGLLELAGRLEEAPVRIRLEAGLAVVGPRVLALACARSALVQLAARCHPSTLGLALPEGAEWAWARELPHGSATAAAASGADVSRGGGQQLVAVAERPAEALPWTIALYGPEEPVPPGFGAVIRLEGLERASLELAAEPSGPGSALLEPGISPEFVSEAAAGGLARSLARRAARLGIAGGAGMPERVAFADLPSAEGGGLRAVIGRTAGDPLELDLVGQGPHAIVGGITGSGKSELLISWVAGLAAAHGTEELAVLLVDYKGGTAFRPLEELPHVVGVVTDLSGTEAERALSSLRAELRHREGALAEAGVRDLAERAGLLPRLVVVVDEFAALLEAHPQFAALFTDIAARGRALGVHLILATQRPAGVVRDALLANCPLRLSLRVQSEADSRWLIGSDAAARLPARRPGRALVAVPGAAPGGVQEFQTAVTVVADLEAIRVQAVAAQRTAGHRAPRRPWLPPLPAVLSRAEAEALAPVPGGSVLLGLADAPEQQRRTLALHRPSDGPLLVLGGPRSGKSVLLQTVARRGPRETMLVGADPEAAWDAVAAALAHCENGARGRRAGAVPADACLLLLDDVDAAASAMGEEHLAGWIERLCLLLRIGPAHGVHCVLTAQRAAPELRPVLALAGRTLLLRLPNRQEHLLAGGSGEHYEPTLPPGGGELDGRRIQLIAPEEPPASPTIARGQAEAVAVPGRPGELLGLVARTRERARAVLRASGFPGEAILELPPPGAREPAPPWPDAVADAVSGAGAHAGRVVIGDPESWSAHWALFARLRAAHPIVFLGCTAVELRSVTRVRAPLPPLSTDPSRCWVLTPEGEIVRGQWPG